MAEDGIRERSEGKWGNKHFKLQTDDFVLSCSFVYFH